MNEKRKVTALLVYLAVLTAYFAALIVIQSVLVYGR
jgi:hypothetical protein